MSDPIEFYAQIAKVQTLADGGLRFTFDVPEMAIMAAAELMACKVDGHVVDVVVTARPLTEFDGEAEKDPERSGLEMDGRRVTIRRD